MLGREDSGGTGKEVTEIQLVVNCRHPKAADATSSLAVDEKEIEANQFAAEILMPKRFLLRELADNPIDLESDEDILRLSAKYAVSSQAMTYRIANIFM
ncbi:ImmA/IrrE family metallo-endopeptidase [Phyllobacterium zundukense]|uniref:ImmA/IrrE family metallo-endopeptidase n=1 Tax=Phyllobacterium zundukense TaxID=1867719 RepID=UPI0012FFFB23|nr:ImmA/IrrE family metallo-endopeptidase [Phyllobacterium zundukense]